MRLFSLFAVLFLVAGSFAENASKYNLNIIATPPTDFPDMKEVTIDWNFSIVLKRVHYDGVVVGEAYWNDTIATTGWADMGINMKPGFSDDVQAYAAGWAEGMMSGLRIEQKIHNMDMFADMKKEDVKSIYDFLVDNYYYTVDLIEKNPKDTYFLNLRVFILQFQGMFAGYNEYQFNRDIHERVSIEQFLALNAFACDLDEITEVLAPSFSYKTATMKEAIEHHVDTGRCSAGVRAVKNAQGLYTDILTGHTTWAGFNDMIRMNKFIVIPGNMTSDAAAIRQSYTGYPGTIYSGDDWYILDSGLTVTETTTGCADEERKNKYIKPDGGILLWLRVMTANRIANSGKEWVNVVSFMNSGTGNNQWFVTDYNQFQPPQAHLAPWTLSIYEQIPGGGQIFDATSHLADPQKGYWPSYNSLYTRELFVQCGFDKLVDKWGDWFTYDKTPRAQIFARDFDKVQNLGDFKNLLRYNNFHKDPLSLGNGENSLCARSDLNPSSPAPPFPSLGQRCHGGTDTKVTDYKKAFFHLGYLTINGPTHNEDDGIPPYNWSVAEEKFPKKKHEGHLSSDYKFDWVSVTHSLE